VLPYRFSETETHGNEQVGDLALVLEPGLTVLGATPLDITQSTVGDHAGEEERVEPREGARETSDQAPVQSEVEVASVVNLASLAICNQNISIHAARALHRNTLTPPINKNLRTVGRGQSLGVLHGLPRQLRESVTGDQGAALLLTEAVLLTVGGVPDPVDKQVRDVEESEEEAVPVVLAGVVVGQVNGAVAVAQRHTGQVPEDEHEAPLLVVHIPNEGELGSAV